MTTKWGGNDEWRRWIPAFAGMTGELSGKGLGGAWYAGGRGMRHLPALDGRR